jgi:hypothetical protein
LGNWLNADTAKNAVDCAADVVRVSSLPIFINRANPVQAYLDRVLDHAEFFFWNVLLILQRFNASDAERIWTLLYYQ